MSNLVTIEGLSMSYREGESVRPILRELNVGFQAGAFSALLGPSGCGKSTLLNLIGGLDKPDTGKVLIDGTDITLLGERERTLYRRRHIGIVFQFFNLLPGLNVLENVLLPLQLNGRQDRQRALDWLERVGLSHRAKAWPDRLSGGEQQRVAIVRAMLHEPRLILADEPTGNLDEASAAQIAEMLLELVRAQSQTLIMVTHNAELAARADAVYQMHEGKIEAVGSGL